MTSLPHHPTDLPIVSISATKRIHTDTQEGTSTAVIDGTPITLALNGITHAVMMASPANLGDFALDFALSGGIIDSRADWRDADMGTHPHGLEVHAEIASHCFVRLKERRRTLASPTGCGLCGIESLQTFEDASQPLVPSAWLASLADTQILDAIQAMTAHQPANALTGGLHATGWIPSDGNALLHVLEDVGRRDAFDKLIDRLAQPDIRPSDGFIVMISCASFGLTCRCVQLQVPLLATISAPSSLTVHHAKVGQLTLLASCQGDSVTRLA